MQFWPFEPLAQGWQLGRDRRLDLFDQLGACWFWLRLPARRRRARGSRRQLFQRLSYILDLQAVEVGGRLNCLRCIFHKAGIVIFVITFSNNARLGRKITGKIQSINRVSDAIGYALYEAIVLPSVD